MRIQIILTDLYKYAINTPLQIQLITRAFYILIISGIMLADKISAQNPNESRKILRGLVVDAEENDFLAGVHIYAKIAHVGAVSDQNGVFRMLVDPKDTLVVTFVGYERQIIPLAYFTEQEIDILISIDTEVIELPGITIFGEPNIDYLKRKDRNPLKIHGLKESATRPEVDVPVGSLDYGPLSRWGKEAKEKRKLLKVYQETQRNKIYVKTVSSDSVKNVFMYRYGINDEEYNDFIIFFNSINPLMDRQDPKDIIRVMHLTFLRYRPRNSK